MGNGVLRRWLVAFFSTAYVDVRLCFCASAVGWTIKRASYFLTGYFGKVSHGGFGVEVARTEPSAWSLFGWAPVGNLVRHLRLNTNLAYDAIKVGWVWREKEAKTVCLEHWDSAMRSAGSGKYRTYSHCIQRMEFVPAPRPTPNSHAFSWPGDEKDTSRSLLLEDLLTRKGVGPLTGQHQH